jgi:DNA-binding SARP family transcriptional activator
MSGDEMTAPSPELTGCRPLRFGILGPLEVWDGDQRLAIEPQQTALLAVLLLNANSVVSVSRLVDHLWGDRPPASARHLLRGCVAGLRRALRVERGQRLVTRPPGYLLEVQPGELDRDRFEELAGAATAQAGPPAAQAAELLRAALACWRGPALDGLDLDVCRAEAASLEEQRLALLEERIEADLRLRRYPALVAELQALVRQHPLRERLWAQLMTALHGAHRQADALAAYQQVRRALVEQLGIEPGAALQAAQRLILTGTVDSGSTVDGVELSIVDSDIPGPDEWPAPVLSAPETWWRTGEWPVPAQLPADVGGFTGRAAELAELSRLLAPEQVDDLDGAPTELPIAAICGTAGVGKSALAVRWAHRARARFPDGQLYVNLRGFDPDLPVTAPGALAGLLTALGVPGHEIPADQDARAARFRTALAGRRMLLVLDNARSVEQVRPLLPGTPTCAVLVTSRDSLAGLVAQHGARRLPLEPLPALAATALLRRLIGPRVDAEPAAAGMLADQCARLPLALRVAAELASSRPTVPLIDLVGMLADQRRRLDLLDAGGDPLTAVRAAFSWSYRRLPVDAARMFRLLGLHPGPDLDAHAASALAGVSLGEAGRLLDLLTRASLLCGTRAGRFMMHDLLRAYAAWLATFEESDDDRRRALDRLFDHLCDEELETCPSAPPS